MAEEAVQAPSADVEAIATQMHTLIQQVEGGRGTERARVESNLLNVAQRNVKVLMEQRSDQANEFWQDWANG